MEDRPTVVKGRAGRVRKNLKQGIELAWSASPRSLLRYTLLGVLSAAIPPVNVYLGATLVNRISEARLRSLHFSDMLPFLISM